ncbi:UDP-N-acetylmuramoyl-tripeptide--D-alanyl-D-alanine ligase [Salinispirillum marinum]|uniref:UDP-N-acetylmuramoyl-tripeptide--D-alanyl-D-alanine ligase n=2 Tax=Saccharospirillaceae TaxID=255527 RepID=A0ABV8BCD9_9GAMM
MMRPFRSIELAELYADSVVTADVDVSEFSIDSRTLNAGSAYIALRGSHFDGHAFNAAAAEKGASLLVVDHPDTGATPQWIVPDTRLALGKIAAANRALSSAAVVALTGSSGKTTTKEMIAAMLSACGETLATQGNLNNEIGVPKTLLRIAPEHQYAVVELGANHLGEIAYTTRLVAPDVALVLNAGRAHLAEFGSEENIRQAKGEILEGLSEAGVAVLNKDDKAYAQWVARSPGRVVSFSVNDPSADVLATLEQSGPLSSLVHLRGPDFEHSVVLPLAGAHNVANLAAAVAVMVALALPDHAWIPAIENINSTPGRLEQHKVLGWQIIDDTYNANPESVQAAIDVLSTLSGEQFLILGDLAELGEHTEEAHAAIGRYARPRIAGLWTVGQAAQHSSRAFGPQGRHFSDQVELINALVQHITTQVARGKVGAILVKGSRSAAMDKVVQAVLGQLKKGVAS